MAQIPFKFQLFKFDGICQTVALTLCPLIGKMDGIEPICYSRNVEFAGMIIFQPATLIMNLIALFMTGVMIYHVKTKYTAVGRKEITLFFQLYLATVVLEMLLVSSIIPSASILYPFFTAMHLGLISTTWWCLVFNGFVGFQFAEDGTPLSIWSIRIASLIVFLVVTILAMATFHNVSPFNYTNPTALWSIYFFVNGSGFIIYTLSQIFLVAFTLDDRWPLGDIAFGTLFFAVGQVFMYIFSVGLCEQSNHLVDGLFFGSMSNLLAVMMVYKYWDSITKEDLEFSIDAKQQYWQFQALLKDVGEDKRGTAYDSL
ncbi:chitin synthase III catalytic subunit [Radiomyces spectabilis]|uniref:chitin synthase III catalytic subunit n=1 Tax=Radiomyces spectabilis TaxID=64574 RepID=UPI00221EC0D2|nr:chitin synthase III catalytic subunit [Radiomyces spectabilis]KAI8388497.1 chitin synthase III catalytic subunit [Radiomyces spectabilis]